MKIVFALAIGMASLSCSSIDSNSDKESQREFLPPLMGWSSWNTYRVNINEELIKKQADAMLSQGLKDAGYQYINIDDGFFGGRAENGEIQVHAERFPNGMKVVSDYIHSLGLNAGIYAEAGHNTCGSVWDADEKGIGSGLYGYEMQDIKLYLNDWNYDFIKIDYCGAQDLGLDEEQRYQAICDAIDASGRTDVSINICRWAYPGLWARRMARSWRMSQDITPSWNSVKNIIRKNLYLSAYSGQGHYNDMDMLELGRGLTPSQEEVHFGMWCIMSSPLLIGCDLTTIPEASLELLKNSELIALNQDVLGLQAYVAQRRGDAYVLVKDIEEKRGKMRAVAFYNPTDTIQHFNISLSDLELGGKTKVRDLIARTDVQDAVGKMDLDVQPHGVKIFRLEAEERLDPLFFEAERALLPLYDDLGKNPRQIFYKNSTTASGNLHLGRLGGSPENVAIWNNVYSTDGGEYNLTVYFLSEQQRKLQVRVNGTLHELKSLSSGDWNTISSVTLPITLKKGDNTIVMGNDYGWAPDIDCFKLERK